MKKLTRAEELELIQAVYDEDQFLENGGGRMVFDMPRCFIRKLGLNDFRDYVLKIALGEKGLSQNILEIDTFLGFNKETSLAEIVACGSVVEIMERVDTELGEYFRDYFDIDDFNNSDVITEALVSDFGYGDDEAYELSVKICNLIDQLNDINGETSDNLQFGINYLGEPVAYDFGFDCERGARNQCSDTREYVENSLHREALLNFILELANEDPVLFEEDPAAFMAAVEKNFFDYINGEDAEEFQEPETEVLHGFTNFTNLKPVNDFCWQREVALFEAQHRSTVQEMFLDTVIPNRSINYVMKEIAPTIIPSYCRDFAQEMKIFLTNP